MKACTTAIVQNKDAANQVTLCRAAVEEAYHLPRKDRLFAFVYLSTAYLRNQQIDHCLSMGDKAIKMVTLEHPVDSDAAAAYLVHARCYEARRDYLRAEPDVKTAEDLQRNAWNTADPSAKPAATDALKATLRYHAMMLKGLNRDGDAIACNQEAAKL